MSDEALETDADFRGRILSAAGHITSDQRFIIQTHQGHDLDVIACRYALRRKGREPELPEEKRDAKATA